MRVVGLLADQRSLITLYGEASAHDLRCAPVISLFLVVQVPDASDVGGMAIFLRPLDCLTLRLECRENVVGMVLDNIVVDGVFFGPTLWTRLDIDIGMVLSRAVNVRGDRRGPNNISS